MRAQCRTFRKWLAIVWEVWGSTRRLAVWDVATFRFVFSAVTMLLANVAFTLDQTMIDGSWIWSNDDPRIMTISWRDHGPSYLCAYCERPHIILSKQSGCYLCYGITTTDRKRSRTGCGWIMCEDWMNHDRIMGWIIDKSHKDQAPILEGSWCTVCWSWVYRVRITVG